MECWQGEWGDALIHACIVVGSISLVTFNLLHELPHFFSAKPDAGVEARGAVTPFACTQDAESPIWLERLPFFVTDFIGASWCSTAIAARYWLRGGSSRI